MGNGLGLIFAYFWWKTLVHVITVLKKDDDILLQTILYNSHPGTPMPNICHFLDTIISILIKSITSIFLNIFPILVLSQLHIQPPPILNICSRRTRPFSARLLLSRALGEDSGKAGGRTEKCV